MMTYQARRTSPNRAHYLKKSGELRKGMLVDSIEGFIVVEPRGSNLGDGEILPSAVADYELRPAWCQDSPRRLADARKLLQLDGAVTLTDHGNDGPRGQHG